MRVAVLVIASPGYDAFAALWARHAARAPPEFTVRFLVTREADGVRGQNWVFPDVKESLVPGVLDKTLLAFRRALDEDFDVVVRTNMSSFYHWRALRAFLDASPSRGLAAGLAPDRSHLSGCNLVLSRDVVEHVLAHQRELDRAVIDDVALAAVLLRDFDPAWVPRLEFAAVSAPMTRSGRCRALLRLDGDARHAPHVFHVRLKTPGARDFDVANFRALVDAYDPGLSLESTALTL